MLVELSVFDDKGCLVVGFRFCPLTFRLRLPLGVWLRLLCSTGSSLPMHSWAGVLLVLVTPRRKLLLSDVRPFHLTLCLQQLDQVAVSP